MYKHIIFDFGGVILDLGGKHTGIPGDLSRIFTVTEDEAVKIWAENKEELLTGKETPEEFLTAVAKILHSHIDIKEAYEKWKAYNRVEKSRIDWKLLEYVKHLRKRYAVHVLTDTIDLDRESDTLIRKVDSHFENVFKSYEEKLRKPDKKAFLNVLMKINAKPKECIFVDDFQANVTAASELGMKGVLFTNLGALRKDFEKLGIAAEN